MNAGSYVVSGGNGCPKCSIIKKNAKHICYARGDYWFKKCVDTSDTEFDHTEGIQACKEFCNLNFGDNTGAMYAPPRRR